MAMAKIYARAIEDGRITLEDVPKRYHDKVVLAYHDLFGIWLEEPKA